MIVSLNTRLAETDLAFIVDDAQIELLVTDDQHISLARSLRSRCRSLARIILDSPAAGTAEELPYESLTGDPAAPSPPGDLEGLAAISYTGGTTGQPKGVMLSHDNLMANARHNLIATGHMARDRWLHVCPMFHVAGTANLYAATWVGATQVVLPRFDAARVLETIERERITHVILVPTMLGSLLDHPAMGTTDLSSLAQLHYAASPIAPELQRRVLKAFECDVVQFYGMTEAALTVTHLSAEDHRRGRRGEERFRRRLRSMGVPVASVQVEIRDADDRVAEPGTVGELCVRGPNIMMGYWERSDATAAALADGWYRSGDGAYADDDGYLYLVDRLKDMIITGGENVYSVEVEAVLLEHADVVEAAVFGIPDARWGEAVHAVVAVRAGARVPADDLAAHCRGLIAGFKVPRGFEVSEQPLPRSGAGKILKNELREPYWAGEERRVG